MIYKFRCKNHTIFLIDFQIINLKSIGTRKNTVVNSTRTSRDISSQEISVRNREWTQDRHD